MKITNKKVANIHYTLKDKAGALIDTSEGKSPLTYIHGMGNLIPGMEKGLEGKAAGDKATLVIPPEEAYGIRDEKLTGVVPMDNFQDKENIKPGAQFIAKSEQGQPRNATVVKVEDNNVTVDFNHPLANVELHFDVEVVEVRDATEDELSHGHIHGEGCDH